MMIYNICPGIFHLINRNKKKRIYIKIHSDLSHLLQLQQLLFQFFKYDFQSKLSKITIIRNAVSINAGCFFIISNLMTYFSHTDFPERLPARGRILSQSMDMNSPITTYHSYKKGNWKKTSSFSYTVYEMRFGSEGLKPAATQRITIWVRQKCVERSC